MCSVFSERCVTGTHGLTFLRAIIPVESNAFVSCDGWIDSVSRMDVPAAVKACSRCERDFDDGLHLAGSCSTCVDGDSLCQKCVARHATDAHFKGHSCRAIGEAYAGADLLERLGLASAPKACPRHAQLFLSVHCAACVTTCTARSAPGGLSAECIKEHTLAYPMHLLGSLTPDVAALRVKLGALAVAPVTTHGSSATSATEVDPTAGGGASSSASHVDTAQTAAQTFPLVENARRKIVAIQAELDVVVANKESSRVQLEANRDAILATVRACFEASVGVVEAAASAKQTGLESELVDADAALELAIFATAALSEVCAWSKEPLLQPYFSSAHPVQAVRVLDDADIVQHAQALTERFDAAQAAVAAIPDSPVTSSSLAVKAAPGSDALREVVAGLLGAQTVEVRAIPVST